LIILLNGYFYNHEKLKVSIAVDEFSKKFNISKNFYFTVHSINEDESKKINKKTFNKNFPTDVLSFPLYNNIDSINNLDKNMSEDMGDMFICRNVIKKNAKIYNKDFSEELQYIVIHGLLHLIGYSHKKNDKLKIYEEELMKRIWNES
jgi:probable rRNA maturation factor|tara:strand:+ start:1975 stop:2418 length:444 start_codon:yes stop_codon:yes gene_type:complete